MRKSLLLLFCVLLVFVTGCDETQNEGGINIVDEKFIVNSVMWGSSWESVKDEPQLKGYKVIKDDGNRFVIEIDEFEYLGQKGKLRMEFSEWDKSFPSSGLIQAYFGYDENIEEEIIATGVEIYGERKSFFLDKDGIENPLNPPAWYSETTIEDSLSEEEKEEYLKYIDDKIYHETQIDAYLRGPLVVITVEEEKNMIRFQGNSAAVVENLKK